MADEQALGAGNFFFMSDDEIEAMMRRDAVSNESSLEAIRNAVREKRELDLRVASLQEELDRLKARASELERSVLPELFSASGVTTVGIEASGNEPAYVARIGELIRCSISSEWEPERRREAFATCDAIGLGDLLKCELTVNFPRSKRAEALALREHLMSLGHDAGLQASVHWQTLTAAVKSLVRAGKRPSDEDLSKIGGYVGKIVTVKRVEDDD